jgi:cell division protein FtsL
MKKRPLLFIILFVVLVMGLVTFFGEKGILHLLRLKRELTRIKEENQRAEEENQRLREEVKRLQQEKRYIEEIARKELGMVKEGEVIYQFDVSAPRKESSK